MKEVIALLFLLLLVATTSFKTGYALFSDSVGFTFDLQVGEFAPPAGEIFSILSGKPLVHENVLPGVWSDYGMVKLNRTAEGPARFYLWTTSTDGNICPGVDMEIDSSLSLDGPWTNIYTGKMEEIRGDNDKVDLAAVDVTPEELFVRQRVKLQDDADKNFEGKFCDWDEVFTYEDEETDYIESFRVNGHILSAWFWKPPSAKVEKPNGGEEYETGDKVTIKWKSKSPTHDKEDKMKVSIYLFNGTGETFVQTIAIDEENDGKYDWFVPEGLSGEYKIKIFVTDGHGLSNEDFSDESFTVLGDLVEPPEVVETEQLSILSPENTEIIE